MSMMERIKHALGGDLTEQDESDNNEAPSIANSSRPQNENTNVPPQLSSIMSMNEGLQVHLFPTSNIGSMDHGMGRTRRDSDLGLMSLSSGQNLDEPLHFHRPMRGSARQSTIPDLYYHSPGASIATLNTSALTNTSPVQHPTDKAVPSSSFGIRGLEESMGGFPSKRSLQHVDKSTRKDIELDMNLPFPVKLHYILSNPKYQDCVAWLPHGRAWRVLKPKSFERRIIPKFFRSEKYASFMRQVNGWAFTRVTEGPDLNAYYHEMFLRGVPDLAFKMKRPPKVKNAASAARNAAGASAGTPDFYMIAQIAPLPTSFPFKPEILEIKGAGTGVPTTRYVIRPLSEEETIVGIDELPLQLIADDDVESMDISGQMAFSDPFSDEASDSTCSSAAFVSADRNEESLRALIRDTTTDEAAFDGKVPTAHMTASGSANGSIIQQLTKADISYLAHQNRILLEYFKKQGTGVPDVVDHPL